MYDFRSHDINDWLIFIILHLLREQCKSFLQKWRKYYL